MLTRKIIFKNKRGFWNDDVFPFFLVKEGMVFEGCIDMKRHSCWSSSYKNNTSLFCKIFLGNLYPLKGSNIFLGFFFFGVLIFNHLSPGGCTGFLGISYGGRELFFGYIIPYTITEATSETFG